MKPYRRDSIWWLYAIAAVIVILGAGTVTVLTRSASPEEAIVGTWREVSWQFEKVDANVATRTINDYQKAEVMQNMIVHMAEKWQLDADRTVNFIRNDRAYESLQWAIKGRGHMLEFRHKNNRIEDFQIQQMSNDTLILHYNSDLQTRGIVKMTFVRE